MKSRAGALLLVAPVGAMLLASCASAPAPPATIEERPQAPSHGRPQVSPQAPPQTPAQAPSSQSATPISASKDLAWEQQRREHADDLMGESRWSEAATEWEILAVLRPGNSEYEKKLADSRAQSASAATSNLEAANEARRKGENERATLLYLKALRADPENVAAAQALRELDREQPRKSNMNPYARMMYGERVRSTSSESRSASMPRSSERADLDTGILLFNQGDYVSSIQTLQEYLRRYPQDDLGKRTLRDAYLALANQRVQEGNKEEALANLEKARKVPAPQSSAPQLPGAIQSLRKELAEDYYQQGLRAQRKDLKAAIRLWELALQYDPAHAQASVHLQQARRMQQTLEAIPSADEKR
jgi:tetratricopeptide (TPR) repeat protein